jgi:hypothetical protein
MKKDTFAELKNPACGLLYSALIARKSSLWRCKMSTQSVVFRLVLFIAVCDRQNGRVTRSGSPYESPNMVPKETQLPSQTWLDLLIGVT